MNTDYAMDKVQNISSHFLQTPFYQQKLKTAGIGLHGDALIEKWSSIPFTTKDELRNSSPQMRSPFGLSNCEYFFSSSGTSGNPTAYMWTERDSEVLRASAAQAMRRVGVKEDDVALVIAPMGLPIMWYCMIQQYNVMGAGVVPLGVRPPVEMVDAITQFPVSIMTSLPVGGTRLFELMASLQRSVSSTSLRHFHCGGDFLSDARRRRIEQFWDVKCYDFYGLSEIFGPIAGECVEQNGLHFLHDYVLMEVLHPDTKKPVKSGEMGVAVYTTLWEKGNPLLRYWTDDYVQLIEGGEEQPRMKFIGRPIDMVVLHSKRIFASQLEELVLQFPQVGNEYRFDFLLEKKPNRVELTVENVPGHTVPKAELQESVEEFLHLPVTIDVKPPASLPRDSAKPQRIVVNPR